MTMDHRVPARVFEMGKRGKLLFTSRAGWRFGGLIVLPLVAGALARSGAPLAWQFNVPVSMRDGVLLAANVYRPAGPGRWPVILIRTPYNKQGLEEEALFFAEHGYAVVAQDVRGRYDSEDQSHPFLDEARDGYDSIEWAARQPWSTGQVVTWGASYVGIDQ